MSTNKIFTLIPKIMAEVGAIEKTRTNSQQGSGYKFRGIDDVYGALQGPLSRHGVFYAPNVLESSREERASKSGGTLIYTVLKVEFSFYADDGSCFKVITVGEAMDSGDKSSNKAQSAALKVALLQTFCVPTEEEKDTEYQNPEPQARPRPQAVPAPAAPSPLAPPSQQAPRPNHQQLGQLFALIRKAGWSESDFRDYLKETTGLVSTREMSQTQYDQAMRDIPQIRPPARSVGLSVDNSQAPAPKSKGPSPRVQPSRAQGQ